METETTKKGWHIELGAAINGLAEELGLDDMSTQRLREFIFENAKEQYRVGNRSGIRWARMNPNGTRALAPQVASPVAA